MKLVLGFVMASAGLLAWLVSFCPCAHADATWPAPSIRVASRLANVVRVSPEAVGRVHSDDMSVKSPPRLTNDDAPQSYAYIVPNHHLVRMVEQASRGVSVLESNEAVSAYVSFRASLRSVSFKFRYHF